MNSKTPTAQPTTNDTNGIGGNLTCIRCGYDLRGLSRDGVCAECANPIRHSLRSNRLMHADPHWLNQLRSGAVLMLLCVVICTLLDIGENFPNLWPFGVLATMAASTIPILLFMASVFLLTTREPCTYGAKEPASLRGLIRAGAVLALAAKLISFAPFARGFAMTYCIACLFVLGTSIAAIGTLVIVRRLARRIPDDMLALSTSILILGTLIAILLATAMNAVILVDVANSTSLRFHRWTRLIGCSGNVVQIPLTILCIHATISYYRAFKSAASRFGDDTTAKQHESID